MGPPEIAHDEIILEKQIGEGNFGKVYIGKCRGKAVAVKVPFYQDLTGEELASFQKEIKLMR